MLECWWYFWLYWYSYALNNPLRFVDPSGYYNKPSPLERERANGEGIYYNYELAGKMAGLNYREHYSFYDHYTWVEGSVSSGWVRNEKIFNVDFHSFFDDLAAEYNGDDFNLSLEFGYGDFWVIGNSSLTGSKSSFGGLNDLNFESYAVATVFGNTSNNGDYLSFAPEQDLSGFGGALKYFWTGGNIDGYHYNSRGNAVGLAPITGMPPSFIGGPLRKGQSAIKLGKYLFNPTAFHGVKKSVLMFANPKSFSHVVGTNPDLLFKGGKIWLTGTKTGGYYRKSYETGMKIADFLSLF